MILTNLTARRTTPDEPASVVFEALGPCGHETLWRATYPANPEPDVCAEPACGQGFASLGRDTMTGIAKPRRTPIQPGLLTRYSTSPRGADDHHGLTYE